MSVADEIVAGERCMTCQALLVDQDGVLNAADAPVFCEPCWRELPQSDRDNGAPYFDATTGEIATA